MGGKRTQRILPHENAHRQPYASAKAFVRLHEEQVKRLESSGKGYLDTSANSINCEQSVRWINGDPQRKGRRGRRKGSSSKGFEPPDPDPMTPKTPRTVKSSSSGSAWCSGCSDDAMSEAQSKCSTIASQLPGYGSPKDAAATQRLQRELSKRFAPKPKSRGK